jgi:hypothetical protein
MIALAALAQSYRAGESSGGALPGNGNGQPRAVEGAAGRAPKTIAELLARAYPEYMR